MGDSFLSGEGTPLVLHLLLWEEGGGNHVVGGTPIMPLPTRANPGLCCNRIKKKQELYALENLQEQGLKKRHFFADKFLKHFLDLCSMSI